MPDRLKEAQMGRLLSLSRQVVQGPWLEHWHRSCTRQRGGKLSKARPSAEPGTPAVCRTLQQVPGLAHRSILSGRHPPWLGFVLVFVKLQFCSSAVPSLKVS